MKIFSVLFVFVLVTGALAQQGSLITTPFPIELDLIKAEPDHKGTDAANIYTIQVDPLSEEYAQNRSFFVLYYLDDRLIQVFENQTLPFSFKRNFKGQRAGAHKIKIVIEDSEDNVLAAQTATVNVVK